MALQAQGTLRYIMPEEESTAQRGKVQSMPDQSSAATEHALLQEITEPLANLPEETVQRTSEIDFPLALRGYDRFAVDAYVSKTTQLVAELQARSSPQAAIRRALERVGEEVSGILQRAHETAEQITTQSRSEAEDRLEVAREEAGRLTSAAEERVKELDADTDRIWAERDRIVADARDLARQLSELADVAAARFPPAEDAAGAGEVAVAEDEPDEAAVAPSGSPAPVWGGMDSPIRAVYDGESALQDATQPFHVADEEEEEEAEPHSTIRFQPPLDEDLEADGRPADEDDAADPPLEHS
jgi:hypothetical protein